MRRYPRVQAVAAVVFSVVLVLAPAGGAIGFVQPVTAAENLHGGEVDPSTVNETEKVSHRFAYRVDNVSNDGNSDKLFLEFPNDVNLSASDLSSFSGNVTNANTGASISIASSVSIVDGPDGDGVKETVTVGIQPSGEPESVDLLVVFTGDVSWPGVDGDTDLPIEAAVTDSKFPDVGPQQVTSVTVRDTDGSGSGGDGGSDSGSANFDVGIDSTTSPVTAGNTLDVTTTVTNDGSASGTQTVSLSAGGSQVDSTSVSLDAGASQTVTLSWSTGSGDTGDQTVTVASANDSASTTVTVQESDSGSGSADLSVSIDSITSPVTEGERVTVDATVSNSGSSEGSETVTLSVDGSEVDSETVTVAAGSSTSVSLTWSTEPGDAGDRTLTVSGGDASAETILIVECTPVNCADLDDNGSIETDELKAAVDDWSAGEYTTDGLQAIVEAWARA